MIGSTIEEEKENSRQYYNDEGEEEESSEDQMLENYEELMIEGGDQNANRIRPVSILENGLDLNENDFNFDMNKNYGNGRDMLRDTFNGTFYEGNRAEGEF